MIQKSLFMLAILFPAQFALAHRSSDAFIRMEVRTKSITGQVDFAVRDLEWAFGLDANHDHRISWGELKSKSQEIKAYLAKHLSIIKNNQLCALSLDTILLTKHNDGTYAAIPFGALCEAGPGNLRVVYTSLFESDADHRGLFKAELDHGEVVDIFSPERTVLEFDESGHSAAQQNSFRHFVLEGIWHIYTGYDHLLFLVLLLIEPLLAAGHRRESSFRDSTIQIAKLVTTFTVAHSLTLGLITLKVLAPPPSRIIESLIALSIVLTAANVVYPFMGPGRRPNRHDASRISPMILGSVFAFGMIHGMGFAAVLLDIGLSSWSLGRALFGFNMGVELAQLSIVVIFCPLAFKWKNHRHWNMTLQYGCGGIALLISVYWLILRSFY